MAARPAGVAVVGSINADVTAYVSPLPRPGETVVAEAVTVGLGGKGANQAAAAARAGAPTWMVGAVGTDVFGDLVLGALNGSRVNTETVQVVDGPTGLAHIRVDAGSGANDIAIATHANGALTTKLVENALQTLRDQVSVVLAQLEIPVAVVSDLGELCRDLGLTLVLDPAPVQPLPVEIWASVSVVTPNEVEASALAGMPVADEESAIAVGRWFVERGTDTAVITRGEHGAVMVTSRETAVLPALPVRAVDTTAAGDAFTGFLGAALARDLPWPEGLRQALAAGALTATVRGASSSLPTAQQVRAFLAARAT